MGTKRLAIGVCIVSSLLLPRPAYAKTTLSSTKVGDTATMTSAITGSTWLCGNKDPRKVDTLRVLGNTLINGGRTATNKPLRMDLSEGRIASLTINGQNIEGVTPADNSRYRNAADMVKLNRTFVFREPLAVSVNDTVAITFENIKLLETGLVDLQFSLNTENSRDWGCVQDKTTKFEITETGRSAVITSAQVKTNTPRPTYSPTPVPPTDTTIPTPSPSSSAKSTEKINNPKPVTDRTFMESIVERIRRYFISLIHSKETNGKTLQ